MPSEYIHFNISKTALLVPQLEGLWGGPAIRRGFGCAFTTYCVNYQLTTPPPHSTNVKFFTLQSSTHDRVGICCCRGFFRACTCFVVCRLFLLWWMFLEACVLKIKPVFVGYLATAH